MQKARQAKQDNALRNAAGSAAGATLGSGGRPAAQVPADPRTARLAYFATQQHKARVARVEKRAEHIGDGDDETTTSTDGTAAASTACTSQPPAPPPPPPPPLLPGVRRDAERRKAAQASNALLAAADDSADPGTTRKELVAALLASLARRLGPGSDEHTAARRILGTVLRNAGTKPDPKYRRLKSGNDRLWASLLQHPEAVAVLVMAGFKQEAVCHLARPPPKHPPALAVPPVGLDAARMHWGAERDRLQVALEQQLGSDAADPAAIESLMAQLEATMACAAVSEAPASPPPPPASEPAVVVAAGPSDPVTLVPRFLEPPPSPPHHVPPASVTLLTARDVDCVLTRSLRHSVLEDLNELLWL